MTEELNRIAALTSFRLKTWPAHSRRSHLQSVQPARNGDVLGMRYTAITVARMAMSLTDASGRMEKLLGDSGPSSQANAASSSSSQVRRQEDRLTSSSGAEEFAGSASLRSSCLVPPQLLLDLLWCADTGATAHMTLTSLVSLLSPSQSPSATGRLHHRLLSWYRSIEFVPELEGRGSGL